MFIELHMIQSFAPSNLNRDDTGNPKDTEFGGVRRARISSQALKRAMRLNKAFEEATQVKPAVRTRLLARKLVEKLTEAGKPEDEADLVAQAFAAEYSGKMDKGHTSVLLYLSDDEIQMMADGLIAHWDEALEAARNPGDKKSKNDSPFVPLVKKLIKETKNRTSAPDIALFGRMLADKPALNLAAACQVAHAISTHRVSMEMDFFTAVDDLQEESETGAGMMGITPFNSACFYRYARIDWVQLVKNLHGNGDLARKAVEGFLRASLRAIPTGKQNSFAAQNPPSLALAVVRDDGMSWSLANAFEKPVRPKADGGYVAPSIEKLDEYWGRLTKVYGGKPKPFVLQVEAEPPLKALAGAEQPDAEKWVKAVLNELPKE